VEGSRSERSIPSTNPDFLWSLPGSLHFMRLSLKKGAHVGLSRAAYRKSGQPRFPVESLSGLFGQAKRRAFLDSNRSGDYVPVCRGDKRLGRFRHDPRAATGNQHRLCRFSFRRFLLPFIFRVGKSFDQKLPDQLKGLGGSCQASYAP
jgi:hypothetical protein